MNEQLVNVLAARRLQAGKKAGQPISYDKMANIIDPKMTGTTLYRFMNGTKQFGVVYLRMIARWANRGGDAELLRALALYALDVSMEPVDN